MYTCERWGGGVGIDKEGYIKRETERGKGRDGGEREKGEEWSGKVEGIRRNSEEDSVWIIQETASSYDILDILNMEIHADHVNFIST